MMRVSIITACYNRKETIGHAIESVLGQTYPDIEYIVVDGASTDGSTSVIEECLKREEGRCKKEESFAEQSGRSATKGDACQSKKAERKVKYISEPDRGMYEAVNKGIRMATGDVIALCHSDDRLYDERTVERVVRAFEEHSEAGMVYADGLFVDAAGGKTVRVWKGKRMRRWRLCCGWLPLHTTCFVRSEVYRNCGLYDESYKIAADTKLLLNILYKHRVRAVYLPQYVVRMLMGGASTDMHRQREMWKEDIRVFRETGFRFPLGMKLMKMMWKPAQFVRGWMIKN